MESKHEEINQMGEATNLLVVTPEPETNQPPTLQPEPVAQSNQRRIKIAEVKTRPPFKDLFPVAENVLKAIQNDMEQNGYDLSQAIIVWKKEMVVVDGHTRLLQPKSSITKISRYASRILTMRKPLSITPSITSEIAATFRMPTSCD